MVESVVSYGCGLTSKRERGTKETVSRNGLFQKVSLIVQNIKNLQIPP